MHVNKVPKAWAMADIYCQLIANDDDRIGEYDMLPRIGAFEISHRGVLIYSKMLSQMWPHTGDVAERIRNVLEASKKGEDEGSLRKKF